MFSVLQSKDAEWLARFKTRLNCLVSTRNALHWQSPKKTYSERVEKGIPRKWGPQRS
jgi:hypothetical protein